MIRNVLTVEDYKNARLFMNNTVKNFDYQVTKAPSRLEQIESLKHSFHNLITEIMHVSLKSPDAEIVYQAFHNEIWATNISPMTCAQHQEKVTCLPGTLPGDELEVILEACCQSFADQVVRKCRTATHWRNTSWTLDI